MQDEKIQLATANFLPDFRKSIYYTENGFHEQPLITPVESDPTVIIYRGTAPRMELYMSEEILKIENLSVRVGETEILHGIDLILGKAIEEALRLKDIFLRMIKSEATEEELGELDEAICLQDISHMPTRENAQSWAGIPWKKY